MGLKDTESSKYSYDEYLSLEEKSEPKNEFWNGKIVEIAGGTPNHSKISNSIGTAIDIVLDKKGKDCTVYNSDLKIYIPNSIEAFMRII